MSSYFEDFVSFFLFVKGFFFKVGYGIDDKYVFISLSAYSLFGSYDTIEVSDYYYYLLDIFLVLTFFVFS
jgi:hypothetical protein